MNRRGAQLLKFTVLHDLRLSRETVRPLHSTAEIRRWNNKSDLAIRREYQLDIISGLLEWNFTRKREVREEKFTIVFIRSQTFSVLFFLRTFSFKRSI